jgi:hypothetical protein
MGSQNRQQKGQIISQIDNAIQRIDNFTYVVKSQSGNGS